MELSRNSEGSEHGSPNKTQNKSPDNRPLNFSNIHYQSILSKIRKRMDDRLSVYEANDAYGDYDQDSSEEIPEKPLSKF